MVFDEKNLFAINNYLWEIPQSFRSDMKVPARVYASKKTLTEVLKDKSLVQLINGATLPGIINYSIAMPDCHEGYGVPIGFVGAMSVFDGVISPGACGFDINCGMRLLLSEFQRKEIKDFFEDLAREIEKEIPSGLGRGRGTKLPVGRMDKILEKGAQELVDQGCGQKEDIDYCESRGKMDWADPLSVSALAKNRGRDQLGTLGSGNHFLEIQEVEKIFNFEIAERFGLFEGQVAIAIHCGSRGLGHQICTDYLKTMAMAMEKYKIEVPDKEFACAPFNSYEGQKYFSAMACAANYAWANRQTITHLVRKAWRSVLGEKRSSLNLLYDVAHNIIKKEKHFLGGKEIELVVHRKGATRAFPKNHSDLPDKYKNTGQPTILPGTMGTASYIMNGLESSREAFYSTAHGAGRIMSRQAAKKAITGERVIKELKERGIIIKCRSFGGIAEEAPIAYKDIEEVAEIVHSAGLSGKVARLVPLVTIKGE